MKHTAILPNSHPIPSRIMPKPYNGTVSSYDVYSVLCAVCGMDMLK